MVSDRALERLQRTNGLSSELWERELTRKHEIFQCLDAYSAASRVDEKDVGGFEGGLARRSPEPQLAVIFPLLIRGAVKGGWRLVRDVRHSHSGCGTTGDPLPVRRGTSGALGGTLLGYQRAKARRRMRDAQGAWIR